MNWILAIDQKWGQASYMYIVWKLEKQYSNGKKTKLSKQRRLWSDYIDNVEKESI